MPSAAGPNSPASPPPCDEPAVIFGGVDADARLVDDADGDRVAGVEHAKLLELLGGLERGRGKRPERQQEVAAIGVEAEVQIARPAAAALAGSGRPSRWQGIGLREK